MRGFSNVMWRRLVPRRGVQGALLVVGITVGPDSTRVVGGFGGLLTVPHDLQRTRPAPANGKEITQRLPATLRGPGRVLYAPGKEPKPNPVAAPRAERPSKTCPRALAGTATRGSSSI